MNEELTNEQKQELIKYMWDVGFLIQSKSFFELNTEEERIERIRFLINDGYRVQLWGDTFSIINIKGVCIPQELIDELTNIYNYLRKD